MRGLDYYTRTVFEFESSALGAQSGVAGGGRYDGLIETLGGSHTPGMGWAAGVERILLSGAQDSLPSAPEVVELYLALDDEGRRRDVFATLVDARRAGLHAQMEQGGRSLKGQLKHADRIGARQVAIFGAAEIVLKDLESGEQETVEVDAVVPRALRARSPRL